MSDLVNRALSAYYRSAKREWGDGVSVMQPSSDSDVREAGGRQYVVLVNVNGVLAVYRVLNSGVLKRLKRWPAVLGEAA